MSATARGRSPNRSPLDPGPEQASTPMRRTMSPRSESRPGSERSPSSDHVRRNGYRSRSRSRSASRSRMLSRSRSRSWSSRSRSRSRGSRRCRDRSYSETPSPSDNLPRSSKIVVEKLTKNVTESHLREIFGSFGGIESLDLPMNKAFMTNRGTAYILFNDPADAEAAIAHMHEAQLDGAVLNVSIVLPRRAFSQSPPPQSGRVSFGRQRHSRGQPSDSRYSRPSPYPPRSPPHQRRFGRTRPMERHDLYRPRTLSRSRSPRRSRSSELRSTSPPRRRGQLRSSSPRRGRRRSPSYSSYDYSSHSDRSRSPSRSRGPGRYGPQRR
ncbi:hypothetical protein F9C07_1902515 [Aspergillus flavus]|uniref:RRM domain-containing protein n=3 Tax=Aspergillus subgen. Circumdati TaxID=2720871 RepID=A0A7U2MY64_ASPFN|nr:hypothetical protein Ao3042_05991 [Aspergillus oryzae 3.042]KAB8245938.1 hypothetical protein BDV35DRAFT_241680 [Aspergillus flavus]KOC16645.1 hypothetical protein AFLA70_204g001660 [Aspergillus flavus AF70]QRD92042.1 hypothetical protein F9C07_1902515 [Aspergillus flavus]|eukprot:EIT77729.1 hypothetical protein Ao3042_05991 [Aspergillus oryzae 3.042]